MSFFGLFGSKKPPVEKHAARVADKRAQAPDRWDSIQVLGAMKTAEAVAALLPRFTYYADPSITDQDEKDEVFRLLVAAGDVAVEPVVKFLGTTESLGWPLKVLAKLVPAERVVTELLRILDGMDIEYSRDPSRKVQLLQALEDLRDPRIAEGVSRFLEDVNETARFHAFAAIIAQDDPTPARDAAQRALAAETSVRVRNRMFEGFAERGWAVGSERAKIERQLPQDFSLDQDGVPRAR